MKKSILLIVMMLFCTTLFGAYKVPRGWTADIDAALVKARKENKKVLLLFTGSDWCSWCKRLKKDVLDNKKFTRIAEKNFVQVYFDFPYQNKKISDRQKSIQVQWQKKFNVGGYPTTVILDGKGEKLTVVGGYRPLDDYIKAIMPPYQKQK